MLDTKNVEISYPKTEPMKCYRNYLINCRDLLNVYLDSKGKCQMKITDAYVCYRGNDVCPRRDLVIIEPTCTSPDSRFSDSRLRFSDSNFFQTQIFLNHCSGA